MAENLRPTTNASYSMGIDSSDPYAGILDPTVAHLRRMRYFRRQYDQRRALFYRQYLGQRDQKYYPDNLTPRANTFVPYPLSNVETIVSRILDAFFSFEDWFECKARSAADDAAAEAMQHVLQDRLKKAGFIPAFEAFVRNVAIYGFGAMKIDWDWDYDLVTYAEPIPAIDPETGQPLINPMTGQPIIQQIVPNKKPVARSRPKFIPIDIYDVLIDPDGGIVAHLTERTLGQMKREQEMSVMLSQQDPSKQPLYIQEQLDILSQKVAAAERKDPDSVIIRIAEIWNEYDQTQTVLTFGEDNEAMSWKDLRASYRTAGYSPWKRKMYAGPPLMLYHGEIPFSHKKAPIVYTSYIKLPNEIFGLGAIEIMSDLSEALNKMVNMITDNWNLGINRRYAYDTQVDLDHEALNSFNVPGGRVGVTGDPSKAIMPLPFFTPQAGDYQVLEVYKGMIELSTGVSDFYQKSVGGPQGNRTATGIQSVMNESNFRFKMFIRNLELDVLQPALIMCASMVQQYLADDIEVMITGENPAIKKWISIKPEELIGTLEFDLVAANYATNRMMKQRNFMALMNIAMNTPYINTYEVLREAFKLFEVSDGQRLLYSPEQVQMMQAQQKQEQIQMMMLESALQTESKARIAQAKPSYGNKPKEGRPPKAQFEGKIPGAGLSTQIKSLAQGMGGNAMGLSGAGEVVGGQG